VQSQGVTPEPELDVAKRVLTPGISTIDNCIVDFDARRIIYPDTLHLKRFATKGDYEFVSMKLIDAHNLGNVPELVNL